MEAFYNSAEFKRRFPIYFNLMTVRLQSEVRKLESLITAAKLLSNIFYVKSRISPIEEKFGIY